MKTFVKVIAYLILELFIIASVNKITTKIILDEMIIREYNSGLIEVSFGERTDTYYRDPTDFFDAAERN